MFFAAGAPKDLYRACVRSMWFYFNEPCKAKNPNCPLNTGICKYCYEQYGISGNLDLSHTFLLL